MRINTFDEYLEAGAMSTSDAGVMDSLDNGAEAFRNIPYVLTANLAGNAITDDDYSYEVFLADGTILTFYAKSNDHAIRYARFNAKRIGSVIVQMFGHGLFSNHPITV